MSDGLTVPSNSVYTLRFSEPLDTRLLTGTNFYLYDYSIGYLNTSRSFTADGMSASINPTSPITAGDTIQLGARNATDLSGNVMNGFSVNFTVSNTPDTLPPLVVAANPGIAQTSLVPINTQLQILFNKSVQATALSQITLSGGPAITLSRSLTNGDRSVLLVPNQPLAPGTSYTLTIAGVRSTAGILMSAPVTASFTTASGAKLTRPSVTSNTPPNGTTGVAASVTPAVIFDSPVNPISTYNNVVLKLTNTGTVVPSSLSFSADYRTVTIIPTAPLTAATQYTISVNGNVTDQAGNSNQSFINSNFTVQ